MGDNQWTAGTMVTIAMNHDQFNGGKGCGTCIMYRGTGGGVGVTPLSTTQWTMGIVNNQCPECEKGSIDQVGPKGWPVVGRGGGGGEGGGWRVGRG